MKTTRMRWAIGLALLVMGEQAGAAEGKGVYAVLPGTPASIQVPADWSCDGMGSAMLDDESVDVLSCIPLQGGSPVSLQKMFSARQPGSLDAYLRQSVAGYAEAAAKDVLVEPRLIDLAGRKAVEHASKGTAIFDHVGGGASTGELVTHTIVFEGQSAFYQCELTTSPISYTKELRHTYIDFCSSIRFDGTANLSGNH